MTDRSKFTYSPWIKALKNKQKQLKNKTIENQGEKKIIEEHGKQLIQFNLLVKKMIMIVKNYTTLIEQNLE